MYGWLDNDVSRDRAQRAAAQRRAMVKDYWGDLPRRSQSVQYCMCGAQKRRVTSDGRTTSDYYCPNRHRPDHQPGAVYGRSPRVYRSGP
jgi:hypothetical protein